MTIRNLPHIASLAFNRPVALCPRYAKTFYAALGINLGVSSMKDGFSGEQMDSEAPFVHTWVGSARVSLDGFKLTLL